MLPRLQIFDCAAPELMQAAKIFAADAAIFSADYLPPPVTC